MSRKQKKRNKRYRGEDARPTGVPGQNKPVIRRFEAIQRSALSQWLYDHRRMVKYGSIALGIVAFLVLMIIGFTQSF